MILLGADRAAAVREFLIACCGRIARDATDTDRDRAELMRRNGELQQQIHDFQQLPRREPGANLAFYVSGSMERFSFSPGADTPEEDGGPSPVSASVGHREEEGKTDRRSDASPITHSQLAAEIENFREELAAALARSNEFGRPAEEDRMENERRGTEKLQNQDLAPENDELTK
jgi:hypothetical protein